MTGWGECDWCGPSAATSLTRAWVDCREVWVCSRCADEIDDMEREARQPQGDPTEGVA